MDTTEALRVEAHAIDAELEDEGNVGPELAHLARSYRLSPRALIFREPSPDWRLFVMLVPLASRLSLMRNPIFSQLTRAWGLNLRFVGIDHEHRLHDFRELLSDHMLGLLIDWLGSLENQNTLRRPDAHHGLDLLFDALAGEMLTILERAGPARGRHLALGQRLEPEAPDTLFDRSTRYPDFMASLRGALRNRIIDRGFYGRALRSVDLREAAVEHHIAAELSEHLDAATLSQLQRSGVGQHLGAYNWLQLAPTQAGTRAHVLSRLPAFVNVFAQALVPIDLLRDAQQPFDGNERGPDYEDMSAFAGQSEPAPAFDLQRQASRHNTAHAMHWHAVLARAVDAGQDRAVIEALAQRFAVPDNIIRRLWRERPAALGQPPSWHLAEILRMLTGIDNRDWPEDDAQWQALIARAVPAAVR